MLSGKHAELATDLPTISMTSLLAKSPEVSPTKSLLISIKVLDSAQPQMAFVKLNVRRQRSKNVFFPTVALIKKQILKLSWKKITNRRFYDGIRKQNNKPIRLTTLYDIWRQFLERNKWIYQTLG